MERWLLTFFLGAICALILPIAPSPYYVTLFTVVAMLFLLIKSMKLYSGFFFAVAWLLFYGASYNNIWLTNEIEPSKFFDKPHQVTGQVITIAHESTLNNVAKNTNTLKNNAVQNNASPQRFNFLVESIDQTPLNKPLLIRLNWLAKYRFTNSKVSSSKAGITKTVKQGQRWQLTVKLKPAHGLANIGSFSYQTWLRQKGIHSTGYVKNSESNTLITNQMTIRQKLLLNVEQKMRQHELSSFIYALTFGDRSLITKQQWQVLEATGTQHLIAISGLHLGLIATGGFYVFISLFRLLSYSLNAMPFLKPYCLNQNLRIYAVILSCALAFFYAYLAGFALPTIRALIMLLMYWTCRLSKLNLSLTTWLLLSIFFIILIDSLSLISASFWLSLYAVSVIFMLLWRLPKHNQRVHFIIRWAKTLMIIQLGLTLTMLPIVAIYAQQISLMAFAANVVAVPFMSITAIPLSLCFLISTELFLPISEILQNLTLLSLGFFWQWLTWLADTSWALLPLSFSAVIVLSVSILILSIIWLFSVPKNLSVKLSVILITVLGLYLGSSAFWQGETKPKAKWQLSIMDVGQGLAVVIEQNNRAILYDTGASYPSGFNMAEAVLLPYLQSQAITTLDKIIISHKDNDHAGGLELIEQNLHVNSIMANAASLNADSLCTAKQSFTWQLLRFDILSPKDEREFSNKSNDRSCVIKVSDGKFTVLLTGDISKKLERKLIEQNIGVVDLLIVPHHGSNTSSSEKFLQSLKPKYAVVSAGFYNRWHMPTDKVSKRYQQLTIPLLNTAELGMITFSVENDDYLITHYREHIWPFWFAN